MLKESRLATILLLAAVCGFCYGLVTLFQLRFELGDVYPAYSSLRADPLGSKGFYESLRRLGPITIRRHYEALGKITDPKGTTIFYLGEQFRETRAEEKTLIEPLGKLAAGGGRIVITFYPELSNAKSNGWPLAKVRGLPSSDKEPPGGKPDQTQVYLTDKWGVRLEFSALPEGGNTLIQSAQAHNRNALPLPASISWHSGLHFANLDPNWRVLYERGGYPVLIERAFGSGSIVLCSDSYFLSNEALRRERHPDLLAWLVGRNQRVVFDETHLGSEEHPGVMTLARKYRLHGLLLGGLVLAGLFVWKNSLSFIPPYEERMGRDGELITGKDSAAGFINLLRRSISESELLGICLEEWKKSGGRREKNWVGKLDRIEAVVNLEKPLPIKERNPVRRYKEICQILAESSLVHVSSRLEQRYSQSNARRAQPRSEFET
jgi:hypothetical protein